MQKVEALRALQDLDSCGIYVLSKGDLEKLFPEEQTKPLEKSLQRLVADGILERVAKGVYLNPLARSKQSGVVEDIAAVLRRGAFTYVSLESMLAEYGVISQLPTRRITLMTTGARGVYNTRYGTIEFTHTKRRPADLAKRTRVVSSRPLPLALREAAEQDLRRVGRNTEMMLPVEGN